MKFRSLKILLLVFVVLIVVAGVYVAVQFKPKTHLPFANKEFTKIELEAKDTLCVFEKRGGIWKLVVPVEYPVDTMSFNALLDGLKKLEVGEVVSSRKEKYEDFEVGENGVMVKVFWDRRSKELIIGKIAGDFMHQYIRFPPKSETYLSTGLSKWAVYKNSDDWRDHTIFSFDTSQVAELHLGGQKIIHADTGWIKGDTVIESNKINPVLNLLATLRADGFSETDFDSTEFEARIVFKDGTEEKLYIGKNSDKYPAKVEGNSTIFLLYPWKVERLKSLL